MVEASRRGFISGALALVAAPAIVKAASLMPIKGERLRIMTLDDYERLILRPMVARYKDAQRMYSYASSAQVEFAALQTKTPWVQPLEEFAAPNAKIGSTIRIRLPNDYSVRARDADNMWQWPLNDLQGNRAVPDQLAVAAAGVVTVGKVLEAPVTRRFWGGKK